jgi:hypothetical protein
MKYTVSHIGGKILEKIICILISLKEDTLMYLYLV